MIFVTPECSSTLAPFADGYTFNSTKSRFPVACNESCRVSDPKTCALGGPSRKSRIDLLVGLVAAASNNPIETFGEFGRHVQKDFTERLFDRT